MKNSPSPVERFGNVLRELRRAAGLSQEELAFRANLDRTYISMLERGLRQPTLGTLFTLAAGLGVKASAMVAKLEE